ncbi:MAG TPA: FMN-binding negative transcriptional regulator [Nitrososphaerales archaeon]|nr:FMN-binding negative transcriptional regulator [Nitrososphaerales archaeon]
MYNPRWFKEDRLKVLQEEVEKISFGTIVTQGAKGVMASHVPMLIDRSKGERGTLFGHIARGNSQWRDSASGGEGLAIFLGPDAYISPRWYESKKDDGKVVPTWNYVAIHVRGSVTFFEDPERLREAVTVLTRHHESASTEPWQVTDAPSAYIDGELKSIVGFEMPIKTIEGKWKMSQNRPEPDQRGVKTSLLERGGPRDAEVSERVGLKTQD